jgi:hypothetical protein
MEPESFEYMENVHHGLEMKPQNIWELLTRTSCADLVQGQHPVILDGKLPIEDACEVIPE